MCPCQLLKYGNLLSTYSYAVAAAVGTLVRFLMIPKIDHCRAWIDLIVDPSCLFVWYSPPAGYALNLIVDPRKLFV